MNAIFTPYATFAIMGLSERKWNSLLRIAWGRGETRRTNVTISAARRRKVRV